MIVTSSSSDSDKSAILSSSPSTASSASFTTQDNAEFRRITVHDAEEIDDNMKKAIAAEEAAGIQSKYPEYNTGNSLKDGVSEMTDDGEVVEEGMDELEMDEDALRKAKYPRGAYVKELGGFFFADGLDYLSAPTINVPPPMKSYAKAWRLLETHEKLFERILIELTFLASRKRFLGKSSTTFSARRLRLSSFRLSTCATWAFRQRSAPSTSSRPCTRTLLGERRHILPSQEWAKKSILGQRCTPSSTTIN